jgi:hypothetical protein
MSNMQGLATPKAIHQFVHALLDNQNIETAFNALFSQGTSHSFFNADSKSAIQERIHQLDNFWLQRISSLESGSPLHHK